MKKVLLLRHGIAVPTASGMTDYDRPLNSKGAKQITNIAHKLMENKLNPNLIIASTAVRAFTSAGIIKNILQLPDNIRGTEVLYSASISQYIEILKSQKESISTILIVAHNPAISGFISRLTGRHIGMGPGNLFSIELNIEKWGDAEFNSPIISTTFLKP